MNKTEFIEVIAKKYLKKVTLFIVGFGTYSVVKHTARKGHNPMTGKEIKIPVCKAPKFKPGKGDALN